MAKWGMKPCRDCSDEIMSSAEKPRCLPCRSRFFKQTICVIEKCNRKKHARKLCQRHYQQWKERGFDPDFRIKMQKIVV